MLGRGEATYKELCSACHGPDGKGAPMGGATDGSTLAPPLAGVPRLLGNADYITKVLLHGMTGELDGKNYPGGGVMVPMGTNTDEWIADVASYVRNSFGNAAPFVTPERVAAVRKANPRTSMWSFAELVSTTPMPLLNQAQWKASASHNPEAAANGINGEGTTRWESGGGAGAGHVVPDRVAAAGQRRRDPRRHAGRRARRVWLRVRPRPRRRSQPVRSRPTACRCRWTGRRGASRSPKARARIRRPRSRSSRCRPSSCAITQTRHAAAGVRLGDPARPHLHPRTPLTP